jgi:hypothetical protein
VSEFSLPINASVAILLVIVLAASTAPVSDSSLSTIGLIAVCGARLVSAAFNSASCTFISATDCSTSLECPCTCCIAARWSESSLCAFSAFIWPLFIKAISPIPRPNATVAATISAAQSCEMPNWTQKSILSTAVTRNSTARKIIEVTCRRNLRQNVPSIARVAAGAFGFLTLIQVLVGPERRVEFLCALSRAVRRWPILATSFC